MLKAFYFAVNLFLPADLQSADDQAASCQKQTILMSVVGFWIFYEKNTPIFCPWLLYILRGGVRSPKFGLDFRPQSLLSRLRFETEQHVWNVFEFRPQICCTLVHSVLITIVYFALPRSPPPDEKRTGKISWVVNNTVLHWPIVLRFATWVHYGDSWLKPKMTGGTGDLKWQCSDNCHLSSFFFECTW